MPVLLVGTLDTKGAELAFARERLRAQGLETLVIDAGSAGPPAFEPDVGREEVFRRARGSLAAIRDLGDRGRAVAKAAEGVAALVADLAGQGRIEGIFALGGSAGTAIGTAAMRALPVGLPKVMVSTVASGQTRSYVGGSDLILFPSVADLSGLNRITRTVLANAVDALAGMIRGRRGVPVDHGPARPVVTATMFGVTTPCVDRARAVLDAAGCEVLIFHATGVGGQAMEGLVRAGQVQGVLDLTTTELADELVGGVQSAGPDRLEAAIRAGVPQVVSVGALDVVTFGPMSTLPERFRGRHLHAHNPNVTFLRTTPEENAQLGRRMVEILRRATAPVVVMLPTGGISALDAPGRPFYDPHADGALFDALIEGLTRHPRVRLVVRAEHLNDPAFADAAARELLGLMGEGQAAD